MIISTEHKVIYLSNCKCASTTIRKRFLPITNGYLTKEVETAMNTNPHAPYERVKKYLLQQHNIDADTFFLFSTIRNPWERIVSLYNYCKPDKNGVPFWSSKFGIERIEGTSCTFEEFVYSSLYHDYNRTAGSFRHACKNIKNMFGEQYDKFKLYKSEELDINKILSDIDDPEVDSKISKEPFQIVDSNHWDSIKNDRDSKNYRDYYNDKIKDIIADHYKLDIEIGEYEF